MKCRNARSLLNASADSMNILHIILFFLLSVPVFAVPRNPPPVFETDYTLPGTDAPFANDTVGLFGVHSLIVIAYALMIILACLAVHRWRSRKTIFCLSAVSVLLFGFLQEGCPCPVGMFQNITAALVTPVTQLSAPFLSWTVIFLFVIPLFAALFWGRIFCSSVCPFGAIQELTLIKNLKIPENIEQPLGLFRYIYLGFGVFCVSVGLGFYVCRFDPYVGFFRFGGLFPVLFFGVFVFITGLFIGRPFCRFLCPYGALLGLCGSVAAKKVSVTPGECSKCRLCETVCPYNAILPPTELPTEQEKRTGPRRLLAAIVALPVFVVLFAFFGQIVAPKFAPLHHTVRTATLLYAEEQKLVELPGTFSETYAVSLSGETSSGIYKQALVVIQRFRVAGFWFGAWCGLVFGGKLVALSVRRRREHYEVAPSRCFACGRCFWYCPNQKNERLFLADKL